MKILIFQLLRHFGNPVVGFLLGRFVVNQNIPGHVSDNFLGRVARYLRIYNLTIVIYCYYMFYSAIDHPTEDLMIIQLVDDLVFNATNRNIRPVCLPTRPTSAGEKVDLMFQNDMIMLLTIFLP